MGKQNPHRLAHGSSKVRDAGVGGDDQVERRHYGSGIRQVLVAAGGIVDFDATRQAGKLPRGIAFLQ